MGVIGEEATDSARFVRKLLKNLDLEPADLAELLNLHPVTVQKWLEGRKIDLGCAHVLLDLLWRHPEPALDMLAERKRTVSAPRPPWPARIAAARRRADISRDDLLAILNTSDDVLRRFERGEKEPGNCYAVLIDLLHDHSLGLLELMRWQPRAEPEEQWPKRRVQDLLAKLRMTTRELADLLGIADLSVREWIYETAGPGHCTALLLELLDFFPERILPLLREAEPENPAEWPGRRVRRVREELGLGIQEFAGLLGMDYDTLRAWEMKGLPRKSGCPAVLYTLLEAHPAEFMELVERLYL